MGSVRKALTFRQLCLLSLFSTLYLNVGARTEPRPEQEVLARSRIIDHHLTHDRPSVVTTTPDSFVEYIKGFMTDVLEVIDEQVAYANQRFVYANKMMSLDSAWDLTSGSSSDDSNKVASSTPVYAKDKHTTTVSSGVPDGSSTTNTTEPSSSLQLIADLKAFLRTLIQDVDRRVARKMHSLNVTGTKVIKERSLDDSSSTVASSVTPVYSPTASTNESQQASTTDAYTRSASTTTTASTSKPSVEDSQHVKPTQDVHSTTPVPPTSAIPRQPSLVGSISGIPGIHYPDYTDIPITSFTCADKAYLPGFYADLETGCQVFHVCWQHRRESFLCPLGTTFNQALLACDYWYSTNCSLAPHYYDVNEETSQSMSTIDKSSKSMVDVLLEKSKLSVDASTKSNLKPDEVLSIISKFLPVKAKVVIYPEADGKRAKIVASTSVGKQEVVHDEEEQKPFQVKTSTSKPEVLVSTTEGEVTQKPNHIKVGQKVTNPEVSVRDLRNEAVREASTIFMMKLAEKLGFSMAKDSNTGAVDHDFKAFELAIEKLFSSISEMKRTFKEDQSKYKPVEPTRKPIVEVVKEPDIAQKPRGLTKLNPRFIVKPVSLTKGKPVTGSEKPVVPVTHAPKPVVGTKKPAVVHPVPQPIVGTKKPAVVHPVKKPNPYSSLAINPETKAVLINNFLRYLQIRKLA